MVGVDGLEVAVAVGDDVVEASEEEPGPVETSRLPVRISPSRWGRESRERNSGYILV